MAEHSITVVSDTPNEELEALITRVVKGALDAENVEQNCDVCVMITDDENIHELNLEHRGVDRPTDVLSFPMLELTPGQKIEVNPLEIDESTSEEREFAFLTAHGMLHLLGYDHEKGEEDEKLHFSRQEEILSGLGIGR